jgi:hypothetical protein
MNTSSLIKLTTFLLCFASLTAFGQKGKTQSRTATYTPSNDNYGSVQVNYEYAFNSTQMFIKLTQVVVEFSVAMKQNEPELTNELRKRGIMPFTQQSGAGVTVKYEGRVWLAGGRTDNWFPISGSVMGTMTDYAFFEPDYLAKKHSKEYYEQFKTNYYSDNASLMNFTITDVEFDALDRKIEEVRREIAEGKKAEKEKAEKEKQEAEQKEQEEKKNAEEANEKKSTSGGTASSSSSNKNAKDEEKDSDDESSSEHKKSSHTVYHPKSNRQLYDELKAMTDAHPEMLNDPKIRTQLRGYKVLAGRDDRNHRDYNNFKMITGGGYHPQNTAALNSIYQTNANIANVEMAVGAGVDAATNVVNSIVEASNRKEEQKLADYHRRTSSNENKVEAIKHR